MSTKALRIANLLIVLGIGLLLLGIVWSYPTFRPYLETLWQTRDIPTAPPLDNAIIAEDATVVALLPFDETPLPAAISPTVAVSRSTSLTPVNRQATPVMLDSTPTPVPTPQPAATPQFVGIAPARIRISAIRLDAPVVPIDWEVLETADGVQGIWKVPDWRAAGWHNTSALLGVPGNTVLNGHNTTYGEVFRDLYKLQVGAEILLEGEDASTYTYTVESLYILKEANQPLEVRLENARYILPTMDERLTLVTCHPYGSIQNRLIVIARPAPASLPVEGE
ncbi:MAG: sortase [Anaerolineae bacterium]|nr:sortase [Anaerolineae bacterium]